MVGWDPKLCRQSSYALRAAALGIFRIEFKDSEDGYFKTEDELLAFQKKEEEAKEAVVVAGADKGTDAATGDTPETRSPK